jgi:mannose-1-phosphate guanylyltransferase
LRAAPRDGYDPGVIAAMVLAAGLGTRLRPLTDYCAKCLVPVGDRPMLAHVLDRLSAAGVTRVVVNAHHRAADVRAFLAARVGKTPDPHIALSEEHELLGTAGGVARARDLLGPGAIVIWNADVLADVDLAALVAAHVAAPGAEATLLVRPRRDPHGLVGLDPSGRVVRMRSERVADEARSADFLAVAVVGESLRETAPARGCLAADVYIPALRRGALIQSVAYDGRWLDVGDVAGYLEANIAWLDAEGFPFWRHPAARVSTGVELARSIVGEGAEVRGAGPLTRTVVWPAAIAVAPLAGAVVGPGGLLVSG